MFCALLTGASCTEYGIRSEKPDIELSASTLDFGEVVRGTQSEVTFFARNVGRAPLTIDRLSLTDASSDTFHLDEGQEGTVEPGDRFPLAVRYAPEIQGQDFGELQIESNDPEEPILRVSLTGLGVDPRIDVDPETLWFGDLATGETRTLSFDVAARGSGALTLSSIVLADPDAPYSFTLPANLTMPYRMEPGTGFAVDVTFAPQDASEQVVDLVVSSNDPLTPVVAVALYGNAVGQGQDPPTVEITDPDWGNALVWGESTTLRGTVVDDADPPENLLCAWYANGSLIGASAPDAQGNVSLETDRLPLGDVSLSLRAYDSSGASAEDTVDVTVWDKDEPIRYTISGGSGIFDYWSIDDDVTIQLDGVTIFQDSNRTQDTHAPVQFDARVGQVLRITATDVNACALQLDALTLHFGTGAQQALNEPQCLSACPNDACSGTYNGPWPHVFLDEEYVIAIP